MLVYSAPSNELEGYCLLQGACCSNGVSFHDYGRLSMGQGTQRSRAAINMACIIYTYTDKVCVLIELLRTLKE